MTAGRSSFKASRERHDDIHVAVCRQFIDLGLKPRRWGRFAMPGQVKRDHAVVRRNSGIVQDMAELAPVASGSVQADQRNALPRFLKIHAIAGGHVMARRR